MVITGEELTDIYPYRDQCRYRPAPIPSSRVMPRPGVSHNPAQYSLCHTLHQPTLFDLQPHTLQWVRVERETDGFRSQNKQLFTHVAEFNQLKRVNAKSEYRLRICSNA